MRSLPAPLRSLAGTLALAVLAAGLWAGCGGDTADQDPTLNMVTVNWIEGMAMTYLQARIVEDSLGVDVDVREVQGGGIAFSSVASGDRHFFNEAWLPTTHAEPWETHKDNLQKLGYTYRGTTVGLATPAYVEIDTIPDLRRYQDELDGTINGIEAGSAINNQTRRTLERYGLDDAFSVTAASGPATWQALESAVEEERPIVVTGWYPHWKWSEFDLKYVNGARTGDNVDIWGESEDIFTLVDNGFTERFPKDVVCFLKGFEVDDDQVISLMSAFNNRGGTSKPEAARQWIANNPEDVAGWMERMRTCVAADERPQALPDSATSSSRPDA